MTITHKIFDTATLLGVMYDPDFNNVPNYWLGLAFNQEITFDDEYVDFSKIDESRKLAPLVVPTAQGRPIYSAAEKAYRVKPAYLKPKDPVTASRMIRRVAGVGELLTPTPLSPMQRYQAVVADILRQHRNAIERRWEWMACEAVLNGKVTLEGEDYPKTVVDFERPAGHTIVKTAGNFWGDAGISIVQDLNSWRSIVRKAKHGGPTSRLTVGTDVWDVMESDTEVRELLKTDLRNRNAPDLKLGVREGLEVEFMGNLGGGLEVYLYSDYYEDESGAVVEFMSPKDIVLTGPNVRGVRCFGAIQDLGAQLRPLPVFPKMWEQQDPSATFVMSQSAPLMVPVNPANTLKATVVA